MDVYACHFVFVVSLTMIRACMVNPITIEIKVVYLFSNSNRVSFAVIADPVHPEGLIGPTLHGFFLHSVRGKAL